MDKGSGEQIASVNHVNSRDRKRSASETSQCTGLVAKKWIGWQNQTDPLLPGSMLPFAPPRLHIFED
jgi:hypothetical protein